MKGLAGDKEMVQRKSLWTKEIRYQKQKENSLVRHYNSSFVISICEEINQRVKAKDSKAGRVQKRKFVIVVALSVPCENQNPDYHTYGKKYAI